MKNLETAIQVYLARNGYRKIDLKAVLFDMDGVLYDSMKNHTQAWYKAICEQGIECELNEFYLYEGRTGASTIDLLFERAYHRPATEEEKERIYALKAKYFNELPVALPMPGAASLLAQVKDSGLIPVLVTGSGQQSLIDKLNHDYPGIFEERYMVTAFDVKFGKPHPEPYLMGLTKAGIGANEAIVVENAPMGIKSAFTAGIFTVAVQTGPIVPEILQQSGANVQYDGVESLSSDFGRLSDTFSKIVVR